jgi:Mg2+ and Co2+ transporter CorA
LDKAKQELATKEQQLRTAQEAAMSAQERFGLLAPEEQQALLEARQQFQAGAGNVDVEQLRKLRGFSGALDEQIAGEARRRAQQAGFGAFQGEDLRRIQQLEAERQRIQVQVQAQANVIAKLEIDVESVSKEINKQISAQWKTILEDLASNIATLQANENKLNQQRIGRFNRVGP